MPTWNHRYVRADRHVTAGRRIIERQRTITVRQHSWGQDTAQSEELLPLFEATQLIFEDDLTRIRNERRHC